MPRVLLNAASQPIPGVLHEQLPGLRPADAEALLRACGVTGDSQQMQDYLQRHCDCHPLVTGVVAGLVNDYLPGRGQFGAWAADPDHGGRLDLARLDLTKKRNHILTAALEALPAASRRLLSTLSLLPESFDYAMLALLNPHRPSRKPEAGPEPTRSKNSPGAAEEQEQDALTATVRDLEQRGLLQYDRHAGRWDLHPVVRAVASHRLRDYDHDHLGQQIIDHFSQRPQNPYEQAKTVDDLHDGITIVKTLFQLGRKQEAWGALWGDLLDALHFNVEAYPESLSLLRPFFPPDWRVPHEYLNYNHLGLLANGAAFAFTGLGEFARSAELEQVALRIHISARKWPAARISLKNLAISFYNLNRLALSDRYSMLALELAEALDRPEDLFRARLFRFEMLALAGRWAAAEEMWNLLDLMGRNWPRRLYRPGNAERTRLEVLLFPRGRLTEEDLAAAERLARDGQDHASIRSLSRLRGKWRLSRGEHALAAESLQDAIRMAHETGSSDPESETMLALARFRLKQIPSAREEAVRLSAGRNPAHLPLAEFWHALGDTGGPGGQNGPPPRPGCQPR